LSLLSTTAFSSAVEQKLHTLRLLLESYERESVDSGWDEFIQGLTIILDTIEAFSRQTRDRCEKQYADDASAKEQNLILYGKTSIQLLNNLHTHYFALLDKRAQEPEHFLLPTIQYVASQMDDSVRATLLPDFEYNYGYVGLEGFVTKILAPLEQELDKTTNDSWHERVAKISRWTVLRQYPMMERKSVLCLCVLAHEIAHFVDHHENLYVNHLPSKLDEKSFNDLVKQLCEMSLPAAVGGSNPQLTLESVFTQERIRTDTLTECLKRVENWTREIIADILAVHAIGPAYYFSLCEFFARAAAENRPAASHPAMAFRMNLILDELAYLGYFSAETAISSLLRDAKTLVSAEESKTEHSGPDMVAYQTLKSALSAMQGGIRIFCDKFSYKATKYQREVSGAVVALSLGVVPIEEHPRQLSGGKPNTVPAVLNGGWELYKTRYSDFAGLFDPQVSELAKLDDLNQLLFKAIESTEAVRRWDRTR
jgi:hypothetical protein